MCKDVLVGRWVAFAIAGIALSLLSTCAISQVVVVSAKSQVTTLTRRQVEDIFLGRSHAFPGGELAEPIDQLEGSTVRDDFYYKLARKTPSLMKAYWSKMIFTGKGQPPKEVDNRDIKKVLGSHPRFIGYVDARAVDDDLRIVLVP